VLASRRPLLWAAEPRVVVAAREDFEEAGGRAAEAAMRHFLSAWSDANL
jgi:hypothetical protein